MTATAFEWHNYGKSTIGNRSRHRARADRHAAGLLQEVLPARQRHAGRRRPVRSGHRHQAGRAEVRQHSAPKPHRDNVLWPTYTADPEQDGERSVTLRRVGDVQVAMALYKVPPPAIPTTPRSPCWRRSLRRRRRAASTRRWSLPGLAASVSASSYSFREPTTIVARAQVRKDGSLADAGAWLVATLDSLSTTPPTPEEVERARGTILKNIDLLLNQSDQVGLTLSNWAASGDWRLLFIYRDRIKAATPDDVRARRAHLPQAGQPHRRPLHPDREARPGAAAADARLCGDGQGLSRSGHRGGRRGVRPDTWCRRAPHHPRHAGASGLKTVYLPKKTRGQSVNATLTLH